MQRVKRTSTRNSFNYVYIACLFPLRSPLETGEHLAFLAALFEVFIFQTVQISHCVPLAFPINGACVHASGFFADIKISNICTYMQYATCFRNFLLAHSTLYFRYSWKPYSFERIEYFCSSFTPACVLYILFIFKINI